MNYIRLSKEIAYALRHAPWKYQLDIDEEGYVSIEALLQALNQTKKYDKELVLDDLYEVMRVMEKRRFEIMGNQMRALYGHSAGMVIKKEAGVPPAILYHGTTRQAASKIMRSGLKPMGRLFVHLSLDVETALKVGKRRDEEPVLLVVDTIHAMQAGVIFYKGNEHVWLCDGVPASCLSLLK